MIICHAKAQQMSRGAYIVFYEHTISSVC